MRTSININVKILNQSNSVAVYEHYTESYADSLAVVITKINRKILETAVSNFSYVSVSGVSILKNSNNTAFTGCSTAGEIAPSQASVKGVLILSNISVCACPTENGKATVCSSVERYGRDLELLVAAKFSRSISTRVIDVELIERSVSVRNAGAFTVCSSAFGINIIRCIIGTNYYAYSLHIKIHGAELYNAVCKRNVCNINRAVCSKLAVEDIPSEVVNAICSISVRLYRVGSELRKIEYGNLPLTVCNGLISEAFATCSRSLTSTCGNKEFPAIGQSSSVLNSNVSTGNGSVANVRIEECVKCTGLTVKGCIRLVSRKNGLVKSITYGYACEINCAKNNRRLLIAKLNSVCVRFINVAAASLTSLNVCTNVIGTVVDIGYNAFCMHIGIIYLATSCANLFTLVVNDLLSMHLCFKNSLTSGASFNAIISYNAFSVNAGLIYLTAISANLFTLLVDDLFTVNLCIDDLSAVAAALYAIFNNAFVVYTLGVNHSAVRANFLKLIVNDLFAVNAGRHNLAASNAYFLACIVNNGVAMGLGSKKLTALDAVDLASIVVLTLVVHTGLVYLAASCTDLFAVSVNDLVTVNVGLNDLATVYAKSLTVSIDHGLAMNVRTENFAAARANFLTLDSYCEVIVNTGGDNLCTNRANLFTIIVHEGISMLASILKTCSGSIRSSIVATAHKSKHNDQRKDYEKECS